jgi:hypothetical protein
VRYFRRGAHRQNGFRPTVNELLTGALHEARASKIVIKSLVLNVTQGEPSAELVNA